MVSFYHQLHCLREVHLTFVEMLLGNTLSEIEVHHVEHCFDYVQQSIMCSGDTTLEGLDPEVQPGTSPIQGSGALHQCKSWEGIKNWMHANAAR